MKAKYFFITILVSFYLVQTNAQDKKYNVKLDVHSGFFYAGTQYPKIETNYPDVGIDFNYFLTKHWLLAAHWNMGVSYFNGKKNNDDYDYVRGFARQINIGLMAGYYQPITKWLSVSGLIGLSQLTRNNEMQTYSVDGDWMFYGNKAYIDYTLAIPIKINIGFKPWRFLELGATVGCVFPIYPAKFELQGLYAAPQISVLF